MDNNQVAPSQENPQPNPAPTQATNAPVASTTQPGPQVGMAPAQASVANNAQPNPQVAATPVQPVTPGSPQPIVNPAPIQPAQMPPVSPQQPSVTMAVPKTSFWLKPILKRPIIVWTLVVYLVLLALFNIYKFISGLSYNSFLTSWLDDIWLSYYRTELTM